MGASDPEKEKESYQECRVCSGLDVCIAHNLAHTEVTHIWLATNPLPPAWSIVLSSSREIAYAQMLMGRQLQPSPGLNWGTTPRGPLPSVLPASPRCSFGVPQCSSPAQTPEWLKGLPVQHGQPLFTGRERAGEGTQHPHGDSGAFSGLRDF